MPPVPITQTPTVNDFTMFILISSQCLLLSEGVSYHGRLSSVLNDTNLKGKFISNANLPLFLELLEYSGLVILNSKYCFGIPTNEIITRKRSIIDLCLTNSLQSVIYLRVEPKPLGVSFQTCHKVLTVKISLDSIMRDTILLPRGTVFGKLSFIKQNKILGEVTNQIIENQGVDILPDYFLFLGMFFSAKRKIFGTRTFEHRPPLLSRDILKLQRRFSDSGKAMT